MADTKHKFASFAAPIEEDVTAWNTLSDQERREAFNSFVERALAKPPLRMTRDEIMADAVAFAEREAKASNLQALIQQGLDDVDAGRIVEYDTPEEATVAIMDRSP